MIRAAADVLAGLVFLAAVVGVGSKLGALTPLSLPRLAPWIIVGLAVTGLGVTIGHAALTYASADTGRAPTALWAVLQVGLAVGIVATWLAWNLHFLANAGRFG